MDLGRMRSAVDGALTDVLAAALDDAPPVLAEAIRYAVLAPGKRVRPLLFVAAYDAGGGLEMRRNGDRPAVLRLACGVELVHAYSLVHDDLPCMDDDDLRRGRPTVHVRFGEREAILAGAALMPLAVEVVGEAAAELGVDDDTASRLTEILTSASGGAGMVGGQLLDLRAEGRAVEIDELQRIHEGKTARLFQAACLMGGVAAGANEDVVTRLGRYGRSLGLAFQVVDDILDVTGTAQSMGKVGGRDAELGKATYPDLVGLERARAHAADLVSSALGELEAVEHSGGLAQIATMVVERER
jgi:geranylgeranyl pyrophosphate synthase